MSLTVMVMVMVIGRQRVLIWTRQNALDYAFEVLPVDRSRPKARSGCQWSFLPFFFPFIVSLFQIPPDFTAVFNCSFGSALYFKIL